MVNLCSLFWGRWGVECGQRGLDVGFGLGLDLVRNVLVGGDELSEDGVAAEEGVESVGA